MRFSVGHVIWIYIYICSMLSDLAVYSIRFLLRLGKNILRHAWAYALGHGWWVNSCKLICQTESFGLHILMLIAMGSNHCGMSGNLLLPSILIIDNSLADCENTVYICEVYVFLLSLVYFVTKHDCLAVSSHKFLLWEYQTFATYMLCYSIQLLLLKGHGRTGIFHYNMCSKSF